MKDETPIELTRRKILAATGAIGVAGAGAGLGTSAYFSDEEGFTGNELVAGELDMKVGYSAHYSDWSVDEDGSDTDTQDDDVDVVMWDGAPDTTGGPGDLPQGTTGLPTNAAWLIAVDDPDQFLDNTQYAADGNASCDGGTDSGDLDQPVIDIEDVKPGDFGEVTFDFALCDNPGYVWLQGDLVSCSENGVTEPEAEDPDENEDEPRPADPDRSSLWPLAALAGIPRLGGGDDGAGVETEQTTESSTGESETSDRRSAVRKGLGAAGMGAAGLAAASGTASADHDKGDGVPTDPDGPFDVDISNGILDVTVGELGSGTNVQGADWDYDDGTLDFGTLYRETYGFRDGTGPHVDAENNGTVVDFYSPTVSAGDTAESTVEIPVETAGGSTVTLEVERNVTLDPNLATLRVDYVATNPSGSGSTYDDLRLSQYVDYDIGSISDDVGEYFLDTQTDCEFIFQSNSAGLFAGFTAEELSVNHDLREYGTNDSLGEGNFLSSDIDFNNDDKFPDSGSDDVTLTFEWSLGELAPGESASLGTAFVYNPTQEDFETQLCQESPSEPEPTQCADVELLDTVQAAAWVDDGNNYQNGDEAPAIAGSLRDVLDALSSDFGLALSGDIAAEEGGGTGRNCFSGGTTHSVAFAWWVPVDHGNEIQTDSASFDLSFYTEQCRHNDGSGQAPENETV